VSLAAQEALGEPALQFLNRLSDWLFVAARLENRRAGQPDVLWEGGR
jgi:cob(I)alamin adenosyltransferase